MNEIELLEKSKNPLLLSKADRLRWLIDFVKKKKKIDFKKLVATLEIEFGLSKQKAIEYVKTCISAEYLKQKDDDIMG